jgi:putative Mn2+ efflux pump MntP
MISLDMLLLGIALAMDAGVATFAVGLMTLSLDHKIRWQRGIVLATIFGFFQFLMLWSGSQVGYLFTFSGYGHLFQLLVGGIFISLAIKVFQESMSEEEKILTWGILPLLILGLATSIDALGSGFSLGPLPHPHLAAFEVGAITFFICLLFYTLSQFLNNLPTRWLLRSASVIFLYLGGEIFWTHLLKGLL